jgi:hypothetical protein
MSFQLVMSEILAERLERSPDEMGVLLKEAFAELSRRRWAALTPQEKEAVQAELENAKLSDQPIFPGEMVAHMPLSMMPFFVRRIREDLATARAAWLDAYQRYLELQKSMTLWYHEEKKYQITAAEKKADVDPRVMEVAAESRRLKSVVEQLERAESNVVQELEVRLVLVRAGVLPDPEAVPTNFSIPLRRVG